MLKMKYYGLGRRKCAIAHVYLEMTSVRPTDKPPMLSPPLWGSAPAGQPYQGQKKVDKIIKLSDGTSKTKSPMNVNETKINRMIYPSIIINQKKFFDYFQNDQNFIQNIQQILEIFDPSPSPLSMKMTVSGGGLTGQKEAIYLALARALRQSGFHFHSILKKKKLLTQDARKKERKKYGLKKARKAPQYSKR